MIGEDFGPVRVLATGGVAVFYGSTHVQATW